MTGAIVSMSLREARAITDQIKSNLSQTRALLLEMQEREGWRALGYLSWSDYLGSEFPFSRVHAFRQFTAALIEENVGVPIGTTPESHVRPLTRLEPEEQRVVWEQAVDTAPNGKLTAAHVQRVVNNAYPLAAAKGPVHVGQNSGNNEWYTPPEYIFAARTVMGGIDLDPASSEKANEIVGADRFFTTADDGLMFEWQGRVWMNPPYSQPQISEFCRKFVQEYTAENITDGIVLVNNATETVWFQELLSVASAACLVRGRVKFLDPDGNPGAPLQGQAAVYFGSNVKAFSVEFSHFGKVLHV